MTHSKLILIIDDEHHHVQALEFALRKHSFRTIHAPNGKEGLKTALEMHPDLILLDIIMPVMDGMTMMKKLQDDAWGRSVPLIFLSNLNESEEIKEWLRRGNYDYMVKSDHSLDNILAKVKNKIGDAGQKDA